MKPDASGRLPDGHDPGPGLGAGMSGKPGFELPSTWRNVMAQAVRSRSWGALRAVTKWVRASTTQRNTPLAPWRAEGRGVSVEVLMATVIDVGAEEDDRSGIASVILGVTCDKRDAKPMR
jgi:hypothetical protein